MSEEKLYAVKNYEGKWLCIEAKGCHYWSRDDGDFFDQHDADILAHVYGGHVVTLVEEPEKVVLSKEQAKIVDEANKHQFPANHISVYASSSDEEKLIMEAFANGYIVKKEKKYNVKLTEAEIEHYGLQDCEKEEVTDDE